MKINKNIWFLILLIIDIVTCNFIEQKLLNGLIEKLIFSTVSSFVGVAIAIVGVFLGTINALYLTLHKMLKNNDASYSDDEIIMIKDGLSALIKELKENSLFSVYTFMAIIFLFFAKDMDIPHINWFIDNSICSKITFINFAILYATFLIFWTIIDSMKVIFKVTEAFEIVKES